MRATRTPAIINKGAAMPKAIVSPLHRTVNRRAPRGRRATTLHTPHRRFRRKRGRRQRGRRGTSAAFAERRVSLPLLLRLLVMIERRRGDWWRFGTLFILRADIEACVRLWEQRIAAAAF